MAVTAWVGQGAVRFAFGATQHESSITGFREIGSSTGGQKLEVADGTVLETVTLTTVTALEVDCIPSLAAADLFRYLRETASTTVTLTISGTSSTTESATNPEWVFVCSGWSKPLLDFTPGQTKPMTARFTVTSTSVDVT
jgi:hypothetical protein